MQGHETGIVIASLWSTISKYEALMALLRFSLAFQLPRSQSYLYGFIITHICSTVLSYNSPFTSLWPPNQTMGKPHPTNVPYAHQKPKYVAPSARTSVTALGNVKQLIYNATNISARSSSKRTWLNLQEPILSLRSKKTSRADQCIDPCVVANQLCTSVTEHPIKCIDVVFSLLESRPIT
jgi:hypothetical protein